MTNAQGERLYPIAEAIERAMEKKVSRSTGYRWHTEGMRSRSGAVVKLSTTWFGGKRLCSIEAVERFVAELSEQPLPVLTPAQYRARARQAKERLLKVIG